MRTRIHPWEITKKAVKRSPYTKALQVTIKVGYALPIVEPSHKEKDELRACWNLNDVIYGDIRRELEKAKYTLVKSRAYFERDSDVYKAVNQIDDLIMEMGYDEREEKPKP